MEEAKPELIPALPHRMERGVDELNFAELPICILSSSTTEKSKSGNTQVITSEVPDPEHPGKTVTRKLTIVASEEFGFFTPEDDWVLLGLFQIAKLQNFPKRLFFTRYHLLKLLGWGTNARDYARLKQSLDRFKTVSLIYEKAWWNAQTRSWRSESISILDRVSIEENENSTTRPKPDVYQQTFSFACSFIEWGSLIYSNFLNRGVRELNFHFAKGLKRPTARRLFRYLGKKFLWKYGRLELEMKDLAFAHLGLKETSDLNQVKRTLMAAIGELVDAGALKELSEDERFVKLKPGHYKVIFVAGDDPSYREGALEITSATTDTHVQRRLKTLTQRGVHEKEAQKLAQAYPDKQILRHVEIFDWELSNGKKVPNPGGYLRTRIVDDIPAPPGFVSETERQERARLKEEKLKEREQSAQEQREAQKQKEIQEEIKLQSYWTALSPKEKDTHEEQALSLATDIQSTWISGGGELSKATRKGLLDAYAKDVLSKRPVSNPQHQPLSA